MRRPAPPREIPPPLELECLKALWSLGQGNVHDVRHTLSERRALAYTTVMTLLERLVRKGGVSRRKVGRSFVYSPLLDRECLRRAAVRELVECFFDNSEQSLVAYLNHAPEPVPPAVPDLTYHEPPAAESRLDTALL